MDLERILYNTDHIQLSQTATWEDIKKLIDEAIEYETASVFVPPSYVKRAVDYAKTQKGILISDIGTVIGFPNGYSTTETKVFETKEAIKNGARGIAVVININEIKNKNYDYKLYLTVIIETSLLTEEEKIEIGKKIPYPSVDYIQISTGFTKDRTPFEDIKLIKTHAKYTNIKVAGEIASIDDASKYLKRGAQKIFTSGLVNLVKQEEEKREKFTIKEDIRFAVDRLEYSEDDYHSQFRQSVVLTAKNGKKIICRGSTNYIGQVAFMRAISKGIREFSRIVIAREDFKIVKGIIRQYVILDYCDPKTFEVVIAGPNEEYEVYTLKELLERIWVKPKYDPYYYKRKTNYANPSVYSNGKSRDGEFMFCSVKFTKGGKSYYYISDDDTIEVGDLVIVPVGNYEHTAYKRTATVEVVNIEYFSEEKAPFPIEKVKPI